MATTDEICGRQWVPDPAAIADYRAGVAAAKQGEEAGDALHAAEGSPPAYRIGLIAGATANRARYASRARAAGRKGFTSTSGLVADTRRQ